MSGVEVFFAVLTLLSSSTLVVTAMRIGPERRKINAEAQGAHLSSAALLNERALAMLESARAALDACEDSREEARTAAAAARSEVRKWQHRVYTLESTMLRAGVRLPPEEG